jgi:tetratricopeptide (TPR) repeat protein
MPSSDDWAEKGLQLRRDGKLHEAVDCFRQALEIEPGHFDNRLRLAIRLVSFRRPCFDKRRAAIGTPSFKP